MTAWRYFDAVDRIARAARLEDRRRQVLGCSWCDALFLTPAAAPNATECGPCYRREIRLQEEAADRAAFRRFIEGGGDPLSLSRVEPEPVVEPTIQGVLF